MSTAILKVKDRPLRHVVETKSGEIYCVDSCYTLDHGYETMVFRGKKTGEVTDWGDLYAATYDTEEEMESEHLKVCVNLEHYIGEYDDEDEYDYYDEDEYDYYDEYEYEYDDDQDEEFLEEFFYDGSPDEPISVEYLEKRINKNIREVKQEVAQMFFDLFKCDSKEMCEVCFSKIGDEGITFFVPTDFKVKTLIKILSWKYNFPSRSSWSISLNGIMLSEEPEWKSFRDYGIINQNTAFLSCMPIMDNN